MEWIYIAENLWKDFKYNDPRYRAGKVSLPFKQRVCFSLGHVFSDLCCIVWSTYLLIYFNKVVGLSSSNVGYLFVIAQSADALLTPFIEIGIDRISPRILPSYGRKKIWHLFGTVLVFLSWPLIFSSCLVCYEDSAPSTKFCYYSVVVVVLHVGWSIIRISHLSLMPDIVQRHDEVAELNAIRRVNFETLS
jgi:Na+/melibiose symporter-like transporter